MYFWRRFFIAVVFFGISKERINFFEKISQANFQVEIVKY